MAEKFRGGGLICRVHPKQWVRPVYTGKGDMFCPFVVWYLFFGGGLSFLLWGCIFCGLDKLVGG